jgi:hypothetical protein
MQSISLSCLNQLKFQASMLCILVLFTLVLSACSKDADTPASVPDPCSVNPPSFSGTVNAAIQSSCANAGCHGANSQNGPGALVTYAQIFNARSSIRSAVSSGRMPLGGSLSSSTKSAILCWIDKGAPEN